MKNTITIALIWYKRQQPCPSFGLFHKVSRIRWIAKISTHEYMCFQVHYYQRYPQSEGNRKIHFLLLLPESFGFQSQYNKKILVQIFFKMVLNVSDVTKTSKGLSRNFSANIKQI